MSQQIIMTTTPVSTTPEHVHVHPADAGASISGCTSTVKTHTTSQSGRNKIPKVENECISKKKSANVLRDGEYMEITKKSIESMKGIPKKYKKLIIADMVKGL